MFNTHFKANGIYFKHDWCEYISSYSCKYRSALFVNDTTILVCTFVVFFVSISVKPHIINIHIAMKESWVIWKKALTVKEKKHTHTLLQIVILFFSRFLILRINCERIVVWINFHSLLMLYIQKLGWQFHMGNFCRYVLFALNCCVLFFFRKFFCAYQNRVCWTDTLDFSRKCVNCENGPKEVTTLWILIAKNLFLSLFFYLFCYWRLSKSWWSHYSLFFLLFGNKRYPKKIRKRLSTLKRNDSVLFRFICTGHILSTVFFLVFFFFPRMEEETKKNIYQAYKAKANERERERMGEQRRMKRDREIEKNKVLCTRKAKRKKKCAHIINVRQPFWWFLSVKQLYIYYIHFYTERLSLHAYTHSPHTQ